jgi:hypothetical protein
MESTKKCSFCAEEIQAEAKKCRYCGEWLEAQDEAAGDAQKSLSEIAASTVGNRLDDPAASASGTDNAQGFAHRDGGPTDEWLAFARQFQAKSRKQRATAVAALDERQRESLLQAWESLGFDRDTALPKKRSWGAADVPGFTLACIGLYALLTAQAPFSPQATWAAGLTGIGLLLIGPLWRLASRALPSKFRGTVARMTAMALLAAVVFAGAQRAQAELEARAADLLAAQAADLEAQSAGWDNAAKMAQGRILGMSTQAELNEFARQARLDAETAERARERVAAQAKPKAKPKKDVACRQDLQCWGEKYIIEAGMYCEDSIERLAQYTHEWTDGFFDKKFSRWGWKDRQAGHLTYTGDKIKFQNGFGAWRPMVYQCDFDPSNNRVLAVRAEEGRLPQ